MAQEAMRLGFYAEGEGPWLDQAKIMLESARRVMPGIEVYHLTNMDTREVGAPQIRFEGEMPLATKRITMYSALEGSWCLVDTDIIFQRDIRHVEAEPFDVAVVERSPESANCDYGRIIPYNLGVVFSRSRKFWKSLIPCLKKLPPKLQEWDGGQFVMSYAITDPKCPFKVKVLPAGYNWTPKTKDEDVSEHHIVHYKGKRKAWMEQWAHQ